MDIRVGSLGQSLWVRLGARVCTVCSPSTVDHGGQCSELDHAGLDSYHHHHHHHLNSGLSGRGYKLRVLFTGPGPGSFSWLLPQGSGKTKLMSFTHSTSTVARVGRRTFSYDWLGTMYGIRSATKTILYTALVMTPGNGQVRNKSLTLMPNLLTITICGYSFRLNVAVIPRLTAIKGTYPSPEAHHNTN
ncbi:hypothetical protein FA13DRAFT_1192742 [Coprinellus micaceus]|uniref:Uncharacterized protein n=1 Tax=Coprinellus micaceus TaxID=71717 RepID=A0A4Y7RD44_COPMI|nr:hypothetical protein FA13DRAFT_1192742 [Coprinellus micaceus]